MRAVPMARGMRSTTTEVGAGAGSGAGAGAGRGALVTGHGGVSRSSRQGSASRSS